MNAAFLALVALALAIGVAALIVAILVLITGSRRRGADGDIRLEIQQLRGTLDVLQAKLEGRLEHTEQRGQELAGSLQALSQTLAQTRELLVEMRRGSEEMLRGQQQMAEVLRRVEGVIVGARSRGEAGEHILEAILEILPPEFKVINLPIKGGVVEFAFRLPNGKYVPVDSKWVAAKTLEELARCEDPDQRKRLREQIENEVRKKVEEVRKYLDPDQTLGIGVVAVPEAVWQNTQQVHVEAFRKGVVVISYSMAVPYLLTLLQLTVRFAPFSELDSGQINHMIHQMDIILNDIEKNLNNKVLKGLAMIQNGVDDFKQKMSALRGLLERVRQRVPGGSERPAASLPSALEGPNRVGEEPSVR